MLFVRYNKETEELYVHGMPFDERLGLGKTREELEAEGYLVQEPKHEHVEGKVAVMKFDPEKKELYYIHEDIQPTQEQRFTQLEQTVGDVLLTSAMDKVKIAELEESQGNLLMELAMLKMGGVSNVVYNN